MNLQLPESSVLACQPLLAIPLLQPPCFPGLVLSMCATTPKAGGMKLGLRFAQEILDQAPQPHLCDFLTMLSKFKIL